MQTLTRQKALPSPALLGTPTNSKEVLASDKLSSLAMLVGMLSGGITPIVFTQNAGLTLDDIDLILQSLMGIMVGGMVLGLPTFFLTLAQELRKEIAKRNPGSSKISMFAAYRMIACFRSKETTVSLGTDRLGHEIQAYVSVSFDGAIVSEVIAPNAIDVWDQAAASVVSLYSLSKTKEGIAA